MRHPINDITSAIFPAPCRLCSGPLLHLSSAPLCADCIAAIQPQTLPLCPVCGELLEPEDWRLTSLAVCRRCEVERPAFTCAVAWSAYDNEVRGALHLLKFEGVKPVAIPLGRKLAQAIVQLESSSPREMLVIAVPMHAKRIRERGYNHSILLADYALKDLERSQPAWQLTPAHPLLQRRRATQLLFPLTPDKRREMLDGAFTCPDKSALTGKHVLLIDDIMTTGATARECAKTLLEAGASSVRVATLARAQRNHTTFWDESDSHENDEHENTENDSGLQIH
jgi:ComF family protein